MQVLFGPNEYSYFSRFYAFFLPLPLDICVPFVSKGHHFSLRGYAVGPKLQIYHRKSTVTAGGGLEDVAVTVLTVSH